MIHTPGEWTESSPFAVDRLKTEGEDRRLNTSIGNPQPQHLGSYGELRRKKDEKIDDSFNVFV